MGPGPGQLTSNAIGKAYRLLTRIAAVGPDWVEMERPLTANVSLAWAPRFHAHQPQVSGCGIEHLTIKFKWDTYKGHLKVSEGWGAVGWWAARWSTSLLGVRNSLCRVHGGCCAGCAYGGRFRRHALLPADCCALHSTGARNSELSGFSEVM